MSERNERAKKRALRRRMTRVARMLKREHIDEWVITQRTGRRVVAALDGLRTVHATDRRELEVVLYRDLRQGRTSASVVVADPDLSDLERLIAAAAQRANSGLGPAWKLPPPAAPARVDVSDPTIVADTQGVALATIEGLVLGADKLPGKPRITAARVATEARETAVHTSSGFLRTKAETFVELDATLRDGRTTQPVWRRARRRADVDVAGQLRLANARLRDRAAAVPVAPGRYDVVLGTDAIVCAGAPAAARDCRYRWFSSFVAQADANNQRRGLARYRPGQPVFGDDKRGTGLTLSSDGTLPFGWFSTPFTDLGDAVRSFPLVKHGVADRLAMDLREAGLRKQTGNGGVRNLVLAPGDASDAALLTPKKRPLLSVAGVAGFLCEPRNGGFSAQLGLAYVYDNHKKTRQPVVAGYMRGNLFELFAGARFAEETSFHTWYAGPRLIRFHNVRVQ